jgi:hypothetical protein
MLPKTGGATLGAWWGDCPSYRRGHLRPLDPFFLASSLAPATKSLTESFCGRDMVRASGNN